MYNLMGMMKVLELYQPVLSTIEKSLVRSRRQTFGPVRNSLQEEQFMNDSMDS